MPDAGLALVPRSSYGITFITEHVYVIDVKHCQSNDPGSKRCFIINGIKRKHQFYFFQNASHNIWKFADILLQPRAPIFHIAPTAQVQECVMAVNGDTSWLIASVGVSIFNASWDWITGSVPCLLTLQYLQDISLLGWHACLLLVWWSVAAIKNI